MMEWLELAGTVAGVVYLWLEYRASAWLWVASIAMPAIYLAVYYDAGLYADFGISVYYIVASVYGLVCWLRGSVRAEADDFRITHMSGRLYLPVSAVFAIVLSGLG